MSEEAKNRRGPLAWVGPIVVLVIGGFAAGWLVKNAPRTQPIEEARPPKTVTTVVVDPQVERIAVVSQGTVIPSRRVVLQPQVRGLIVRQHPALIPGGTIAKGEELLGIDRADYEIALVAEDAALEEARYELELERGKQVVAKREFAILLGELAESGANRSLVLREPHLRRAEAKMRNATNQIARARLDLERTSVITPFNVLVVDESVELGQLTERGSPVATLVGTDEFWVQANVSLDMLHWIRFPREGQEGALVMLKIETGNGSPIRREGRVVRLLGDLDSKGRMARVLISIEDPLNLRQQEDRLPLLLGTYVRAEIDAGELENVLTIERTMLREDDRIWVVDTNSQVQIRDVKVRWRREKTVIIDNVIKPGEVLIAGGIRVALPGMKVVSRSIAQGNIKQTKGSGKQP